MKNHWTHWLKTATRPDEVERVAGIGKLLGLKFDGDEFFGSNFERGLLLRQILRERRPRRVLELGTGRGFGTICMADCVASEDLDCVIETIDCIHGDKLQEWPHEKNGHRVRECRALREFWTAEFPELGRRITRHTGATTDTLISLGRQGAAFDFIFIDAAHDLRSVFLDLAGALALVAPGGCILMDDFAPLEAFGLATCIAAHHAKSYFEMIEVIPSEGAIYPTGISEPQRRSMVFLGKRNGASATFQPSALRVLGLRAAGCILEWLYSPSAFRF